MFRGGYPGFYNSGACAQALDNTTCDDYSFTHTCVMYSVGEVRWGGAKGGGCGGGGGEGGLKVGVFEAIELVMMMMT